LALDINPAAALTNNAVTGGEAESAACSLPFSRKERLKQVRFHFVAHANAVVDHSNRDVIAGRKIVDSRSRLSIFAQGGDARLENQSAAVRHRVARVDREIKNDLRELTRIGFDMRAF